MSSFGRKILLLVSLVMFLYSPVSPKAQVITVVSFECGGLATANLGIGNNVTVTHSLGTSGSFASALVQIPNPPFILNSGVQTTVHTAGVPVTQVLPITALPTGGTNLAFAVAFFTNNVLVVCPTYSANITKNVDISNITSLPTTLTYTINVQNTGTGNLDAPVLSDTLTQGASPLTLTSGPTVTSGDLDSDGSIDPGETFVYTVTYSVTQANMDNAGDINNVANFSATFLPTITSNTATTTIAANPLITVTKLATPNLNVPVGTVVTYAYEVENNGNQTITNVNLTDNVVNGSGADPDPRNEVQLPGNDVVPLGDSADGTADDGVWDSLAPGDFVTFTGSYTVTQSDVDNLQ